MNLTQQQIDQFHHDGFLILNKFASKHLCDQIHQSAQKHMNNLTLPIESEQEYQQQKSTTITLRRLRQVYDREDIFKQWMTNTEIRPMLKQLLGETPVLTLAHHNSIMTKMPHDSSPTCWHQDKRYWHYHDDNLLSVWLALDDEYLDNGLLEFIPSSHKLHLHPDQFDERTCFKDNKKNQSILQNKVHSNLSKGDIVFFHCKTLHAASKNHTQKPKVSFVYTVKGIHTQAITNSRSDAREVILDDTV
ncbi:MAG: phytanoyl-CoA dioxygenase family protein [Campylobacterota bacterium]|nr:phytanoyl-CoA dioxygenase family protein [Campylobacterota bacterium]